MSCRLHPASLVLKGACPPSASCGCKLMCAPVLDSTASGATHAIMAIGLSLSRAPEPNHDEAEPAVASEAVLNDLLAERADVDLPVRHHRCGVLGEEPQLVRFAAKKLLQIGIGGRRRVLCPGRARGNLGGRGPQDSGRA